MVIINADCIEAMRQMPTNSVDSVATDPPYELGFMGKSWDSRGIAFQVETWREILRVLKPGGHLLAFGGTRTYHRLVCAVEDAGFEIRDCVQWVHGSGFNKHGTSKLQKDMQHKAAALQGQKRRAMGMVPLELESAKRFDGFASQLKPSHEPIVLARKPLSEKTIAANMLAYGSGALNIDASRIATTDSGEIKRNGKVFDGVHEGYKRPGKSAYTHKTDWKMQPGGRYPANLILSHSPECELRGMKRVKGSKDGAIRNNDRYIYGQYKGREDTKTYYADADGMEEVEDWSCVEGCPIRAMDEQSGISKSVKGMRGVGLTTSPVYGSGQRDYDTKRGYSDAGGASRYFLNLDSEPGFLYCSKSSRREKTANGKVSNTHNTVKPIKLMKYLIQLITPPGGVLLDPFMGSGSTGVAAMELGFDFIGIELEKEYCEIASRRIEHVIEDRNSRLF